MVETLLDWFVLVLYFERGYVSDRMEALNAVLDEFHGRDHLGYGVPSCFKHDRVGRVRLVGKPLVGILEVAA